MTTEAPRLTRRFYRRDPVTLAKALLGQILVRRLPDGRELAGRIVEVEAYLGIEDRAAHSFGGRRTARNASMWGDAGHAYVYFTYGMHWCVNVVSDRTDVPTACLLRALEPLVGIDEMRKRRGRERLIDLCSGPAKLTEALGIDGRLDGVDLVEEGGGVYIVRGRRPGEPVVASPRVGVAYAMEWAGKPLRFFLEGNPHVSGPKKVRGRRSPQETAPSFARREKFS
ncbi:MAG TPA: DNA-3-methyladenine glycosylase [Vicinamibacteria bacterium]|nr:DNA-3-methyladenine glycosylase [Vicinamibacteria bacterium]